MVFLDANILIYSITESNYQVPCKEILRRIAAGECAGTTSTAVLEEVLYLELLGRLGNITGFTRYAYSILTPVLSVSDEIFRLALSLEIPKLGPNDRVHAATCLRHNIEHIISADKAFDQLNAPKRIDPLDAEVLAKLNLGSAVVPS